MPTYEYACRSCGSRLEVVQSFTDEALTTCGECGGSLRKVFAAPGISFKGSGFYKTDSRKGSSSSSSDGAKDGAAKETKDAKDTKPKEPASAPSTPGDGAAKPAAAPAAKPASSTS